MPTITLNKTVFEKLVGKKLPIEELKDRISMLGTDLEGIEGDEITVEVFPNRPDMLSEQGFARAFSSFIGLKPGLRRYKSKDSGAKVIIDRSVEKIRPFTACALVKNLHFDDEKIREVIQIQEKLHITYGRNRKKAAIGIYPLEHITLPIYYKALAPDAIKFQPLESLKEMTGIQILSQHPAGKAYGHLLEGKEMYPIFVDSAGEILSMPPIINSHKTGKISESTTEVFIECSGYDFPTLSICLNMIVTALSDMGGSIETMTLEYPDKKITTPELEPTSMELDLAFANKMLGIELSSEEAKECLERMGFEVELGKKLKVRIPATRSDILHPVDLVEDIAIGYGYDNFKPEIPKIATTASESKEHKLSAKAASVFVGLGFVEAMTYHLTNREMQVKSMNLKAEPVKLKSAVNTDFNELRYWLLPNLMQVFMRNKHHEYPQRIFELGTVFESGSKTESGVRERLSLCAANAHQLADFTEIRQQLDSLMLAFGIKYEIKSYDHPSFVPGRSGKIVIGGTECGVIGELHPSVLERFEIGVPTTSFEIDLDVLFTKV